MNTRHVFGCKIASVCIVLIQALYVGFIRKAFSISDILNFTSLSTVVHWSFSMLSTSILKLSTTPRAPWYFDHRPLSFLLISLSPIAASSSLLESSGTSFVPIDETAFDPSSGLPMPFMKGSNILARQLMAVAFCACVHPWRFLSSLLELWLCTVLGCFLARFGKQCVYNGKSEVHGLAAA